MKINRALSLTTIAQSAVLSLSFRLFFLLATMFAVGAIGLWALLYSGWWQITTAPLAPSVWHGHEMIYGYAVAVITGFLLTAIKNWTGLQTLHRLPLLGLALLWLGARLALFINSEYGLYLMALLDGAFMLGLIAAVITPLWRARAWKQSGLVAKVGLLFAANMLFYAGAIGVITQWMYWGMYSGLYLVIALILTLLRRVLPFFIRNSLKMEVKNWRAVDTINIPLFLLFAVFEVFTNMESVVAILALALAVMHSIRLWGWHTSKIWAQPMLWILYVGYTFIVSGFALKALSVVAGLSPYIALHAFAYGGIGLVTIGMMARVALGHTGRAIAKPPTAVRWIFVLVSAGAVVRVCLSALGVMPYHYAVWVAQILWLLAFGAFLLVYAKILITPRVDGRPN